MEIASFQCCTQKLTKADSVRPITYARRRELAPTVRRAVGERKDRMPPHVYLMLKNGVEILTYSRYQVLDFFKYVTVSTTVLMIKPVLSKHSWCISVSQ
jgi:hypothetical protein